MSTITSTPGVARDRSSHGSLPVAFARHLDESAWLAPLILLALCGFLFLYGLGAGELYRNESLRAIIAAEFLRTGNWIVPTLYGEPLFTKPPGMYAAIALASWPLGRVTEWTARLPSALAATITVFLVYAYFRRQLGRRAGFIAALILPLNVMWLDKATAAEIDMMQVAWVTAAILCFLRALEIAEKASAALQPTVIGFRVTLTATGQDSTSDGAQTSNSNPRSPLFPPTPDNALARSPRSGGQFIWWSAALLCVAGGVLTKWTAPAFFYGTVIPLLWWRGRLRLLLGRNHLLSALMGASFCLAWVGAAVAMTGWRPLYDTVSREALQRLLPSHHERASLWSQTFLHPLKLLATNLPWSVIALFSLRPKFHALWNEHRRRMLQAMHCWVWPNLLFWTLIPQHTARHSFPLFPGIAGLAALVWLSWMGQPERHNFKWKPGLVLVGCLVAWLGVKLVFVHAVIPARNLNREPRAKGEQIAAAVPKDKTLFLFRLKDEGIMFYYGRPARRLNSPAEIPSSSEPVYCILESSEWRTWNDFRRTRVLHELNDEQGEPIILVELTTPRHQQAVR